MTHYASPREGRPSHLPAPLTRSKVIAMQTTIIVKKIYTDTGKTKAGKPYTLLKFLDTDRKYYTTFNPSSTTDAIKEGASVKLEAEENQKFPNTFNITRIIEVDANPDKVDNAGRKTPYSSSSASSPSALQPPTPLSEHELEVIRQEAIKTIQDKFDELDIGELIPLIAEEYKARLMLEEQRFSVEMSIYVQACKLRNMGVMK